jgi:DNA-binding NarL/FixJ family response regulator
VATHTVVIGCGETARAGALTRAVVARGLHEVTVLWPLDKALSTGRSPDTSVIVVDAYPPAEVLRSIADLTDARPELSVLIVGPLQPNMDVLVALASGAFGYLPSGSTPSAIADAVKALLAGEAVLPHAISGPLVQHLRSGGRGIVVRRWNGHDIALTNREWEVLVLLRQARSTSEIARRLVVSNGTVRTHVFALVHKFGVRDRDELGQSSGVSRG